MTWSSATLTPSSPPPTALPSSAILEGGRRYATIGDFENFARLTHMTSALHHGGGTLCEPVDLPVNKRHFDMVFAHIRNHDKAFMGSVTAPERAQDTVDMADIVFGGEAKAGKTVLLSLCNANSPMSWDYNMLGSAKVYAENNQACLITPFILAGAMAPVTVAGTATQTLAEAMAGMAFCQMVRPGAPVVFGSFASSISMQSGAPTFGTPEPAMMLFVMAALARRLGVPFRSGGNLTAAKTPDYQAAYESAATFFPTILAGVNFVLHTAGWLEGGLTMGYEKFILDADQAIDGGDHARRVSTSPRTGRRSRPCSTTLPVSTSWETPTPWPTSRAPSGEARPPTTTASSNGWRRVRSEAPARAHRIWRRMLAEYEATAPGRCDRGRADRMDRQPQGLLPRLRRLSHGREPASARF